MTIARPTICVNSSTHSSGRRRLVTPPTKSLTPHDTAAPSARTIDSSNACDCTAQAPAIATSPRAVQQRYMFPGMAAIALRTRLSPSHATKVQHGTVHAPSRGRGKRALLRYTRGALSETPERPTTERPRPVEPGSAEGADPGPAEQHE